MTREPIIAALFAKLSAISGVNLSGRVLRHYNELHPSDQPALFLAPRAQTATRKRGFPTVWTIDVSVYVYVKRAGNDTVPDTQMNTILDAIEAALNPAGGVEVQTLGGLCDHAWIEGAIETDEGVLGDQAIAIIPIRILVSF